MAIDQVRRNIRRAAELVAKADALLITAGAGMGVDSGLPDFRGTQGFWRAYPALGRLGIPFEEMAQPKWFEERPEMAWAFYGHRQQLYRETRPHPGFRMLLDWGRAMPAGYFVVTSNVDGQFEKAGFPVDRIVEQHGSIHRYQCTRPCTEHTWLDDPQDLDIDLESITARGRLPRCPQCGAMARPNVLMFVDAEWVPEVTHEQEQRYRSWLASVRGRRLLVLEFGAGKAIATIRRLGERLATERDRVTLVRVNPDALDEEDPVIPVRLGALDALRQIEERLPEAEGRADHGMKKPRASTHAPVIDASYDLEPVIEPGRADSTRLTQFVSVQCPYCGESFDTAVDLSAGSFRYFEDCQVCCQPIELVGEVDAAGVLTAVKAGQG